jgi:hypothetical protein
MTRGRPVTTAPTWECHLHLRLRVGEDDDLIAFLRNLPPRRRTTALKAALRAGGLPATTDESGEDEDLTGLLDDFLK